MRIAIVSDIHGNLAALTSVLADIDRRGVDEVVCLGDIVGYGPEPVACVELVRNRKMLSIMGNHDQAAFDEELRLTFSPLARKAIEWTAERLGVDDMTYLRSLPYREERNGVTYVHAAPRDPSEFEYLFDEIDASGQFGYYTTQLCFIGHTHQPKIFSEDLGRRIVEPGRRFIVNVGSVGQPRDGDARACFGVYDTEAVTFEHVRVPYDVPSTSAGIYAAGLPPQLGERLVFGV